MASGYIDMGTYDRLQARLYWSSKINDIFQLNSSITVSVQVKKTSDTKVNTWGTWDATLWINGDRQNNEGYYASVGKDNWVTLRTVTFDEIYHDGNGEASVILKCWLDAPSGTTLADVHIRYETVVTIDKIPVNATLTGLSSTTFDSIDTAPKLYYKNPSGTLLDKLQACISLDKETDLIAYRDVDMNDTTHKLVLTQNDLNNLYKEMPDSNSITTYIYLRSTFGGKNIYSYKSKTFYIKDKSINFNADIVDTNLETLGLTGDKNIIVKGFSNMSFNVKPSPATIGSTITEQSIKSGAYTYTTATGVFNAVENAEFTVYAKDTRGNNTTTTITKRLIDYVPLTCEVSVDMPDIQGNASFTISGNYFSGSFGAVNNELIVLVRQIQDGVEGEWQPVEYTVSGNTFSADGTLGGFSQDKECLVEARVADKLLTKEATQNVLIIPVFDWSHDDFNFNVPVTIQGDLTVKGGISFDYGAQDVLWSGAYYMQDSQTANLNKPISEQANGVVVVFSRYGDGEAKDYGWNSFFVPKSFLNLNNAGGHSFIMATSGFTTIATKYLYFTDNAIKGNIDNTASGTNNGITFNNNDYVLRYVIGV